MSPMPAAPRPPIRVSPAERNAWFALLGTLMFSGLCFGVFLGTRKPAPPDKADAPPVELAALTPAPALAPTPATTPTPEPRPKPSPPTLARAKRTPPAKPPEAVAAVVPAMKPEPPAPKPEPPKPPTVAAVTPVPEPKKPKPPEPKKPEPPPATTTASTLTFAKDVLPIFRSKCNDCHGQPSKKAGLDLRTLASTLTGGDGGAAVLPGNPAKSPVWETIESGDMPPPGKAKLTDEEKKTIREWIAGGAK